MGYIDENGEWVDLGDEVGGGYNANLDPNAPGLEPGTQGMNDRGLGTGGSTVAGGITDGGSGSFGTLTPAQIAQLMGTGGGAAATGGGAGGSLSSLFKALGIGGSGSGGLDLLSLLGPIIGAAMGHSATNKATDQIVGGLHDASAQASDQIGGARGAFDPFIQGGQAAMAKAGGMGYAPLAPQFKPLGSGRSLASFMGSK